VCVCVYRVRQWVYKKLGFTTSIRFLWYEVRLQHTAAHCNTLHHTATHCNTLQHTATQCNALGFLWYEVRRTCGWVNVTQCNTVQHTAAHCNTLQHTATHCNTLQHTAAHCHALQCTVVSVVRGQACNIRLFGGKWGPFGI